MRASLSVATIVLLCGNGCETLPTQRAGDVAPQRTAVGPPPVAPKASESTPRANVLLRPDAPQVQSHTVALTSHQIPVAPKGENGSSGVEALPAPFPTPDERTPATLSLESLEAMALANNPAMREASARIQSARGQFIQAGLPPNPTAGYVGSEIGNDGHAGQQGAFLGQEVVTAGKLRLGRAVALRDIQVAERELAAAQLRVLTDVRMNYYEVLVAQRRLELTESLAQTGRRSVEATQSLLERNEVSQTELLQAKVESDTTQILVNNARLAQLGAWQRLSAVAGQPDLPVHRLEGDPTRLPPPIKQEQAIAQLFAESPELAAAYARVERARWAFARARAQAVPNLDLMGMAQFDNASGYTIAGAQIGMPIPFINRNQGGVQQARAEVLAAEQAAAKLELALRKRLSTVYQRYSTAAQQSEKYSRDIVPDVQQALANTTEGYNAGEFNFLQQLTAQRTYFQTNLAYLDALEVYWSSSRELEGLLLTGSLEAPVQ